MDVELASPPVTKRPKLRFARIEEPTVETRTWLSGSRNLLISVAIGVAFVVCGVDSLDLGAIESRLGLAAGETLAPLGHIYGYWTADIWPAQLVPSAILSRWHVTGRGTTGAIRWPAAIAGIVIGCLLTRSMQRAAGIVASILTAVCWYGTIGLMDRSAEVGIDLILGLGTIATVDRLLTRGSDWGAGAWASLAFLAGGWPPLVVIGLAVIVIGKKQAGFSLRLMVPPVVTAIVWSLMVLSTATVETWASALTLPLVQRFDWKLTLHVFLLALPWSPAVLMILSPTIRESWNVQTRASVMSWVQVTIAALIGGTVVPGLRAPAEMLALAGFAMLAAAVIQVAWNRAMEPGPRNLFQSLVGVILLLWLTVMLYGLYVWNMAMPYYRFLGVIMAILGIAAITLGCTGLASGNTRRSVVTIMVLAVGLKIAHWGYYAPEWNYRLGQGAWGRAIGQWIPRKWPVYTFHPWPTELAFAIERPVRQLKSPSFLELEGGSQSKYVLLSPAEFENWPAHAMPVTVVNRFLDRSGNEAEERILARTAGTLPAPGQKVPSRD
jgi:hypothetical protein